VSKKDKLPKNLSNTSTPQVARKRLPGKLRSRSIVG